MIKYYLGCDVSKGYSDFVLLDNEQHLVEPVFQVDDTPSGHNALKKFIIKFLNSNTDAIMHAGVESTGGYENNWLYTFEMLANKVNLKSARINPRPIHEHLKASMKRTITDKVSARNIAEFMIKYPNKITYNEDDAFYPYRRQWSFIKLLKKQKTQLKTHLNFLLYVANPGILRYCKNGIPEWLLNVLTLYPTSIKLSRARVKRLASIRNVTEERALKLIQRAKADIASLSNQTAESLIQQLIQQILNLNNTITSQEELLKKLCSNNPHVSLLTTFKGVGELSALGLLINLKDINLYPTVKHLASYFGLHPIYKKSGDGTFGMHMSKEGKVQPRAILFMVAKSAIVHNEHIKTIYQRMRAKGMNHMQAMGLCMHKILRILYGMLKNNTAYNPQIDIKNQKQRNKVSKQDAENKYLKKIRRYQQQDYTAPISRRHTRKRKGESGSQSNQVAVYGITIPLSNNENNFHQHVLERSY